MDGDPFWARLSTWVVGVCTLSTAGAGRWLFGRIESKADAALVEKQFQELMSLMREHITEDRDNNRALMAEFAVQYEAAKKDRHDIYDKMAAATMHQSATNMQLVSEIGELRGEIRGSKA